MRAKFKIYVGETRGKSPEKYPAFLLERDRWDDYSTKCQFQLFWFDKQHVKHQIGDVKVLHKTENITPLETSFDELGDEYISLGQDETYYQSLIDICGREIAICFLEAVRDIAWMPTLALPFSTLSSFRNALLRFNSAERARRFGLSIVNGDNIVEDLKFSYQCQLPGSENELIVNFDFDAHDPVPGRIVAIIGRNATGKTRFLAQIARDLVQISQTSIESGKQRDNRFSPQRPIFNQLLALSFSAFDKFARPKTKQISYVYCGIRNEKGALSRKWLEDQLQFNLERIKEHNRESDWVSYMTEILDEMEDSSWGSVLQNILENASDSDLLKVFSSGQAILAHAITSILAWIERDSIILFDEPETHLHPNAVASLFNVYHKILKKYESYSIIATHSPIVIQEIPSKRVILFERECGETIAKKMSVETFGESISELTRHVFDTIEIPSFYKNTFDKLSRSKSFDEIMDLFDNNLSLSAKSYLIGKYKK